MAEPPVTFAGLLRRLRADAGLTQEKLAETAGVSVRSVSDLERGVSLTARRDTARLLADALGLSGAARAEFEAAARGRAVLSGIGAGGAAAAAARTLPRDVASFTGREPELRVLMDAVAGAAHSGGVVGIHAIGGMPGIGKTAFAVHAAHRLAERFTAGQIFLPLHGHTPGQRPVDPADALASLLLTAGVSAAQIPPDLEARMALWRDRLAGKQLLLILDDAADSEQVRPLLPGTGESLVLVTSRRHLTALEDATAISLDAFPPEQAAGLLVRLAARPGLEPADPAVGEIVRLCGYLPLAVGMLGRQLNHHPAWIPAEIAADLAAARDRLELMHTENLSVAAAFNMSYQDLPPDQQRLFRRLGLHPGTDIDAFAAAVLNDTGLPATRRHLEALYDHYLLTEPARGRYRLHDLIREHARALAGRDDTDSDREQAIGRLLAYYQSTAASAEARLARQTRTRSAATLPESALTAVPGMPDSTRALSWARTERANLIACLDYVTLSGDYARVVGLTTAMAALLRHDGLWAEALTRHAAAVQAARLLGDQPGEANALLDLGFVRQLTGNYPAAAEALEQALRIFGDLGDRLGQANVLSIMGSVRLRTGDYPGAAQALEEALEEALDIYRNLGEQLGQARALNELGLVRYHTAAYAVAARVLETGLSIYRNLGDRQGQASALNLLGMVRQQTGDYQGAAAALEEALGISRDLGDRLGQVNALNNLGVARRSLGNYRSAAEALAEALGISRDLGNRQGQANALLFLGAVRRMTADHRGAAEALKEALATYRDLGDRGGEAEALNETGTLHRIRSDLGRAEACHRQALTLAREIASSWDEAHALAGLGRCALAADRISDAAASLRQAREIFQQIGAADAIGLSAELDAVTGA